MMHRRLARLALIIVPLFALVGAPLHAQAERGWRKPLREAAKAFGKGNHAKGNELLSQAAHQRGKSKKMRAGSVSTRSLTKLNRLAKTYEKVSKRLSKPVKNADKTRVRARASGYYEYKATEAKLAAAETERARLNLMKNKLGLKKNDPARKAADRRLMELKAEIVAAKAAIKTFEDEHAGDAKLIGEAADSLTKTDVKNLADLGVEASPKPQTKSRRRSDSRAENEANEPQDTADASMSAFRKALKGGDADAADAVLQAMENQGERLRAWRARGKLRRALEREGKRRIGMGDVREQLLEIKTEMLMGREQNLEKLVAQKEGFSNYLAFLGDEKRVAEHNEKYEGYLVKGKGTAQWRKKIAAKLKELKKELNKAEANLEAARGGPQEELIERQVGSLETRIKEFEDLHAKPTKKNIDQHNAKIKEEIYTKERIAEEKAGAEEILVTTEELIRGVEVSRAAGELAARTGEGEGNYHVARRNLKKMADRRADKGVGRFNRSAAGANRRLTRALIKDARRISKMSSHSEAVGMLSYARNMMDRYGHNWFTRFRWKRAAKKIERRLRGYSLGIGRIGGEIKQAIAAGDVAGVELNYALLRELHKERAQYRRLKALSKGAKVEDLPELRNDPTLQGKLAKLERRMAKHMAKAARREMEVLSRHVYWLARWAPKIAKAQLARQGKKPIFNIPAIGRLARQIVGTADQLEKKLSAKLAQYEKAESSPLSRRQIKRIQGRLRRTRKWLPGSFWHKTWTAPGRLAQWIYRQGRYPKFGHGMFPAWGLQTQPATNQRMMERVAQEWRIQVDMGMGDHSGEAPRDAFLQHQRDEQGGAFRRAKEMLGGTMRNNNMQLQRQQQQMRGGGST